MEQDNSKNQANEPGGWYGIRRIGKLNVYKSFEDAAEAEAMAAAARTPQERIGDTVRLILRVYGVTREELLGRRKKLHIKIVSRA